MNRENRKWKNGNEVEVYPKRFQLRGVESKKS